MSAVLEALRRRFDGHQPGLLGARNEYAVLCPLLEQPDGVHLLFEVRAAQLRQGGEVCFPGGRLESQETPAECALRETEEELSIPRSQIQLLGAPDFICNQRGFLLRPYLGLISPEGYAAISPWRRSLPSPLPSFKTQRQSFTPMIFSHSCPRAFPMRLLAFLRTIPGPGARWMFQSGIGRDTSSGA